MCAGERKHLNEAHGQLDSPALVLASSLLRGRPQEVLVAQPAPTSQVTLPDAAELIAVLPSSHAVHDTCQPNHLMRMSSRLAFTAASAT